MSSNSYRAFLRLLEKWPVDTTKRGGRDLGEHLRIRVTNAFKQGEATRVDEVECQRVLTSLNRLASNTYATRYPRLRESTATGLSLDHCQQINSTDFLEAVQEQESSVYSRLFKRKENSSEN